MGHAQQNNANDYWSAEEMYNTILFITSSFTIWI